MRVGRFVNGPARRQPTLQPRGLGGLSKLAVFEAGSPDTHVNGGSALPAFLRSEVESAAIEAGP